MCEFLKCHILTLAYSAHFIFVVFLILGFSTVQTHPKENDSVNWSNDAGMFNIDALSGNSWPHFILPEEFIWSSVYLPNEPSARTPREDDVCLIALGLNFQLAFHLPQLTL